MRRPRITYVRCSRDEDYLKSLEAVGVSVHAVAPTGDIESALHGADGVVLAGGPDVDPALYGETMHPSCSLAGDTRDAFELAMARRCLRDGVPLLAICRGMQVLNVAAGGSLIQDLPSQVPVALPHALDDTFTTVAHGLEVIDGHAPGARRCRQACPRRSTAGITRPPRSSDAGWPSSAHAPDGIVEAIEATDLPFCVGVQWHPENFWRTGEFLPLFRLFAAACQQRTMAHM